MGSDPSTAAGDSFPTSSSSSSLNNKKDDEQRGSPLLSSRLSPMSFYRGTRNEFGMKENGAPHYEILWFLILILLLLLFPPSQQQQQQQMQKQHIERSHKIFTSLLIHRGGRRDRIDDVPSPISAGPGRNNKRLYRNDYL